MSKADNKQLEEDIKRALITKHRRTALISVETLETFLKELKRLQEENNKLERANKVYINSIQSITPVLLEDYIEKDKIREKIEELKKEKEELENKTFLRITDYIDEKEKTDNQIKILKELLERK